MLTLSCEPIFRFKEAARGLHQSGDTIFGT